MACSAGLRTARMQTHEQAPGLTVAALPGLPGMPGRYGALDTDVSRRGTSPVMIGRAAEMAALEAALEAVRQGSPAALLIGGDAGVGKSRLIAEFTGSARASGARVMMGECLELGVDGLPFGPFTAILRDLVREVGADGVTRLLPGDVEAARELRRLLPELAGAIRSAVPNAQQPGHRPRSARGHLAG